MKEKMKISVRDLITSIIFFIATFNLFLTSSEGTKAGVEAENVVKTVEAEKMAEEQRLISLHLANYLVRIPLFFHFTNKRHNAVGMPGRIQFFKPRAKQPLPPTFQGAIAQFMGPMQECVNDKKLLKMDFEGTEVACAQNLSLYFAVVASSGLTFCLEIWQELSAYCKSVTMAQKMRMAVCTRATQIIYDQIQIIDSTARKKYAAVSLPTGRHLQLRAPKILNSQKIMPVTLQFGLVTYAETFSPINALMAFEHDPWYIKYLQNNYYPTKAARVEAERKRKDAQEMAQQKYLQDKLLKAKKLVPKTLKGKAASVGQKRKDNDDNFVDQQSVQKAKATAIKRIRIIRTADVANEKKQTKVSDENMEFTDENMPEVTDEIMEEVGENMEEKGSDEEMEEVDEEEADSLVPMSEAIAWKIGPMICEFYLRLYTEALTQLEAAKVSESIGKNNGKQQHPAVFLYNFVKMTLQQIESQKC